MTPSDARYMLQLEFDAMAQSPVASQSQAFREAKQEHGTTAPESAGTYANHSIAAGRDCPSKKIRIALDPVHDRVHSTGVMAEGYGQKEIGHMISFNRFVVASTVGMLGLFASQWASAQTCEREAREQALLVDDVDEGDIASYVEGCEAERLSSREEDRTNEYLAHIAAMADVDAYNLALRDVAGAPSFCAVTYIEPDVTHGWRAVCVLDTDDATPSPVPFRMAGAL